MVHFHRSALAASLVVTLAGCSQDQPSSGTSADLSRPLLDQSINVADPDLSVPGDFAAPDLAGEFECMPECPPGWRCTVVGCVPNGLLDLAGADHTGGPADLAGLTPLDMSAPPADGP